MSVSDLREKFMNNNHPFIEKIKDVSKDPVSTKARRSFVRIICKYC